VAHRSSGGSGAFHPWLDRGEPGRCGFSRNSGVRVATAVWSSSNWEPVLRTWLVQGLRPRTTPAKTSEAIIFSSGTSSRPGSVQLQPPRRPLIAPAEASGGDGLERGTGRHTAGTRRIARPCRPSLSPVPVARPCRPSLSIAPANAGASEAAPLRGYWGRCARRLHCVGQRLRQVRKRSRRCARRLHGVGQ
jgi:hypothetical protein